MNNSQAHTMHRFSFFWKLIVFLLAVLSCITIPRLSYAEPPTEGLKSESPLKGEINKQSQALGGEKGAGYGDVALMNDPRLIAAEIIRIFLTFLGIMFAVYTVYGGYLWMTSAGNDDRISKARSIIIHGIIGSMIILFSYTLVFFLFRHVIWKAYEEPYMTYFKWGVLPKGYYNVEGPDALKGQNDPLEQLVPTPDFYPKDVDLD